LLRFVPWSLQTGVPLLHASAPLWHGAAVGLQLVPAAHATHIPPLQTMPVPQPAPSAMLPVDMHTEAPVVQDVVPTLHIVPGGVHDLPAAQSTQAPELQTLSVPHVVPFMIAAPPSTQAGVPLAHEIVPEWQGFAGTHDVPAEHATHAPPLQTLPVAHDRPSAALPVSRHSGLPVLQVVVPTRQGFATAQAAPTLHAAQVPPPQTMSVPHDAPSVAFVAWSVHVGVPALQSSLPAWQGFVGTQAAPLMQAAHVPIEHTMFVPQTLPSGAAPDCMQTGRPVAHDVTPVWHGSPMSAQAAPSEHAPQAPAWHAMASPHGVPSAWVIVVSTQESTPVDVQAVLPVWHGFAGLHATSLTHSMITTSPRGPSVGPTSSVVSWPGPSFAWSVPPPSGWRQHFLSGPHVYPAGQRPPSEHPSLSSPMLSL
jgi:hypothetical protein